VTSLVDDVIMQLIGAIFGQPSFDAVTIHWGDVVGGPGTDPKHPLADIYENNIFIGTFITKVLNFLIVAFVIFLMVRQLNKLLAPKGPVPATPTTKPCPYCKSVIALEAIRCPHCTSDLKTAPA